MHSNYLNELITYIGDQHIFQKKYLEKSLFTLTSLEYHDLLKTLDYFSRNNTLEQIGDAYLEFVNNTLEETKHFVEEGRYRYATLKEVSSKVYFNDSFMKNYMLGLILSGYIWSNHISIHRWYIEKVSELEGNTFLEIGPGHGQYFLEAINKQKFKSYLGVELSPASVKEALAFIEEFKEKQITNYDIICKDFMEFDNVMKYDAVSMSEVLEHVENPKEMLKKIYSITSENANIYITTVINSPAIDHIYLFNNVEEVLSMMNECGFVVIDYTLAMANNFTLEKAIKKKSGINIALLLNKAI